MTVGFTPAQQHLRFCANFARTAANRTQWFSKNGDPHFLLIALIPNTYRDHLYLAGPPVFLQKLMFALLAPLSRIRGYRIEIEPSGFELPSRHVGVWQILLQKSFWGGERKFLEPLKRFTRGDVRDHIVSPKIDHGPP